MLRETLVFVLRGHTTQGTRGRVTRKVNFRPARGHPGWQTGCAVQQFHGLVATFEHELLLLHVRMALVCCHAGLLGDLPRDTFTLSERAIVDEGEPLGVSLQQVVVDWQPSRELRARLLLGHLHLRKL